MTALDGGEGPCEASGEADGSVARRLLEVHVQDRHGGGRVALVQGRHRPVEGGAG
ncbi:MAG: hypothetical protein GVY27_05170 [Deinococcus-Thermus bacterium]|nr:hypothetical protein [Deinococcota bacterium]